MVDRLAPFFHLILFPFILILGTTACAKKEEPKPMIQTTSPAVPAPPAPAVAPPPAAAPQPPPPPPPPSTPQAVAPVPTPVAPAPAPTTAIPPAAPTTAAAPSAPGILAKADGEKPGIRAEVTELKRSSGDIVILKFTIFNDSDKAISFHNDFGAKEFQSKDFNSIGGVNLIDNVGKKKYLVIRDAADNCVCSRELKQIDPKSSANLWAKFPAPPAGVDKISVVIPHFSPLDDIPLSQ